MKDVTVWMLLLLLLLWLEEKRGREVTCEIGRAWSCPDC